ncbi:hypothetical protein M196_gp60 [Halorubrum tailed virus 4]|uniref:Uncharacterized protein n=1 Tax=Halorubrum tailed virus 4 TaxID=1273752 RepID=R4TKF4_9CAUD|nr:hypothetical protein M196_gp60 [Halorubrum tailed virus 4]AGM11152.1 hypothetical protein HRTV4_60 [Halorubrum tailed virus 4]
MGLRRRLSKKWNETVNGVLSGPGVDVDSVNTEEADITGETEIFVTRSADSSTITSGTWENLVDNVLNDNRGEMNGSLQFSPDKSGKYRFTGTVAPKSGASGDEIRLRLYNVTDSQTVNTEIRFDPVNAAGFPALPFGLTREVEAGKTYEIQALDLNSSFVLNSNLNNYQILKEPVNG